MLNLHSTSLLVLAPVILLACFLLAATWVDCRTHRIPNAIVLPGIVVALTLHTMLPAGLGISQSLAGLGIGLAALLPTYLLRATGAGDVKLLAMAGAFAGPKDALGIALATYAAGAVLALLYASHKGVLLHMARNLRFIAYAAHARLSAVSAPGFDSRTDAAAKMPYALAISFGCAAWLGFRYAWSY
jgi:prepilin peptidase CpaA